MSEHSAFEPSAEEGASSEEPVLPAAESFLPPNERTRAEEELAQGVERNYWTAETEGSPVTVDSEPKPEVTVEEPAITVETVEAVVIERPQLPSEPAFVIPIGEGPDHVSAGLVDHLTATISVEFGRARLPYGEVTALPPGKIVELNQALSDPIDMYVNGERFASGHLVAREDGTSSYIIDEIFGR